MLLLKTAVRLKFFLTTRAAASRQARNEMKRTLGAVQAVGRTGASRPVRVAPMPGVDEDMREWSLFMILAHNTIVCRAITGIVGRLAAGDAPRAAMDFKRDVMPEKTAGVEQVDAFRAAVEGHLAAVSALPGLRRTRTFRHPIFGELDAHGWHCMFAFHLLLHRRQAEAAGEILRKAVPHGVDPLGG